MRLNKILSVLFLLGSTLTYAGSQAPAPAAPEVQQTHPVIENTPTQAPAPPAIPSPFAPGQETQVSPLPSSNEMTGSYESAFVRMLVTLLALVFLVFATFWLLRRMGKGKFKMSSGRTINILERRALSPKTVLYIVEIGNKKVLVSESQLEVRALSTYEELPEMPE